MNEGRLLLRPIEAAESLGISRAKLYELLARGEIRSLTIGASRRIPASDLQAYVEHLRSEGGLGDRAEPTARARSLK
jgi:excisionase family DNA binding protein